MHLFWGRTSLSFVSPVFLHMSAYLDCGLKLGRINTFPSRRPSHLRVLHKHHNSGQRIRDAQGAQSGAPAFKVCSSRSAITSMYLLTIYKDLLALFDVLAVLADRTQGERKLGGTTFVTRSCRV